MLRFHKKSGKFRKVWLGEPPTVARQTCGDLHPKDLLKIPASGSRNYNHGIVSESRNW